MAPARDFGYHRDGDRLLAHLDVAWNQVNEAVVGLHEDVLKRKAVPWARVRFDATRTRWALCALGHLLATHQDYLDPDDT